MKPLEIHPLAKLFPDMSSEEFIELGSHIEEHGQQHPIILYEGKILDGRHRYKACVRLGIKPETEAYRGDDPLGLVVGCNLHRRHLTASQRAALAVELLPRLEADAAARQLKALKELNSTQVVGTSVVEKLPPREEGQSKSREKAAEMTGANPRYVSDAKAIKEADKALFKEVKQGDKTISQAKAEIRISERSFEPEKEVLDKTGWPIPKPLIPLWERRGEVDGLLRAVNAIKKQIADAQAAKDVLFSTLNHSSLMLQCDKLHQELREAEPYAVCTSCQGRNAKSCSFCKGRGLLSRHLWDHCAPEEVRRMRSQGMKGKAQ